MSEEISHKLKNRVEKNKKRKDKDKEKEKENKQKLKLKLNKDLYKQSKHNNIKSFDGKILMNSDRSERS